MYCSHICSRSPVTALQKLYNVLFLLDQCISTRRTLNLRSGFSFGSFVACDLWIFVVLMSLHQTHSLTLSLTLCRHSICAARSQLPIAMVLFKVFVHLIKWLVLCGASFWFFHPNELHTLQLQPKSFTEYGKFYAANQCMSICLAFYTIECLFRCRALRFSYSMVDKNQK